MDAKLHRFLFDTYVKLHQVLFWTCSNCNRQVQRYLMNGTPIDRCSTCGAVKAESSLDEDNVRDTADKEPVLHVEDCPICGPACTCLND